MQLFPQVVVHRRHPHGWRGLKSVKVRYLAGQLQSPPAWVAWIEIYGGYSDARGRDSRHPHGWRGLKFFPSWQMKKLYIVATRMGGVD